MKRTVQLCALALGLFCFGNQEAQAQEYNTAIGLRGGYGNGLTIKQMLGGNAGVEGILVSTSGILGVTALYELYANGVFNTPRLNAYYGAGGTLIIGNSGSIGVNGVLGIEYNFAEIPINVSVDWVPGFYLVNGSGFVGENGGLAVRYYF
ncbi:MAG: hypothetical protein ACJAY8_000258 [Sphingobacteriales bacterium]|jgi:hypothetical protein